MRELGADAGKGGLGVADCLSAMLDIRDASFVADWQSASANPVRKETYL
jgi:hypothetical protein